MPRRVRQLAAKVPTPTDRQLRLIVATSAVVSIVALVVALVSFQNQLNDFQRSRIASAEDTCQTLKTVILQAYQPQTPPGGSEKIPAILGRRHTTVTLISSDGKRQTFEAVSQPNKVTVTIIQPKSASGNHTAIEQIRADGLSNCVEHARKQTALDRQP